MMYIFLDHNLLIKKFTLSFYDHKIFLNDYSVIFTIFCFVILINALNFYDGINGQSIIFFIINFAFLLIKSQIFIIYIFLILVLIFILYLNLKNRLFMGDNGIYLFGSILILLIIYEYNFFQSIDFVDQIFFMLILPGFDLLRVTVTRIIKGKNAFYGDRNHLHHLLINKFSLFKTNLILLLLASLPIFLFCIVNLNFFIVLFIITNIYIFLIFNYKN